MATPTPTSHFSSPFPPPLCPGGPRPPRSVISAVRVCWPSPPSTTPQRGRWSIRAPPPPPRSFYYVTFLSVSRWRFSLFRFLCARSLAPLIDQVGFEMVDRIARDEGITMNTIQSKSLLGVGSIGEVPILLVQAQSYMNYSGEAIGPLAAYYQVPLRHILLIYDEMSLPNGVLSLQRKGGHGRHNGLQNVIQHLDGRREFPRLSIGIGSPPGKMDTRAFLLQKFSSEERQQIDTALEQGVDAVRTFVLKGFSGSIERFNLVQKYKFQRV